MDLGADGVQHLLGHLPTWLSYSAREKVQVRTRFMGAHNQT